MMEVDILHHLGEPFYKLSNADGKVWLMPAKNMRTAMNLYQPSGMKGKLLKRWFPWLHRIGIVRKVVKAVRGNYGLQNGLYEVLCRIFHTKELEFSVFFGTPCVHQKITIQLFKEQNILGYCKTSDNDEITLLFEREANTLDELNKLGVKGIPRCLYYGKMSKRTSVFVQSTTKTQRSSVPHSWNSLHETFLESLYQKTKRIMKWEQSDYYQQLTMLWEHKEWIPNNAVRMQVERCIHAVMDEYRGKSTAFSAYHADFTPWNMFVESKELFVFDWEYARLTYPPRLDRYHFFTQTAIFEKHWSADDIMEYIHSDKGGWVDKRMFLLYLLDVISRFVIREKGDMKGDMAKSFGIWTTLLEKLQK